MCQINYDNSLNQIFDENVLQSIKRRHGSPIMQKIMIIYLGIIKRKS